MRRPSSPPAENNCLTALLSSKVCETVENNCNSAHTLSLPPLEAENNCKTAVPQLTAREIAGDKCISAISLSTPVGQE